MSRLNARLDDDLEAKVDFLRRRTRASTTEVIKASLERYYQAVRGEETLAASVLRQSGFVGCGDGPADLSTRAKEYLRETLEKKA